MSKKLFFILLTLIITIPTVSAQDNPDRQTVLVLHELWNLGVWEEQFSTSLTATLRNDPNISLDLSYEFLGLGFVPEGEEPTDIIAHLAYKNSVNPVDLVVAVLPTSNAFLLQYGDELFPNVPKIFVLPGANTVPAILELPQSVVIKSAASTAIENTLNNMLEILPETQHLYIIGGSGQTDAVYSGLTETLIVDAITFDGDVNYLTDLGFEDLISRVSTLPENSAILFLTYEVDVLGNRFTSVEMIRQLVPHSSAPMFGFYDTILGYGIVGGNLSSAGFYGETVAEVALDIFMGTLTSDTVQIVGNTSYIYDWRQLQRWGIPENRLPADSELRFKTISFWEANKNIIIASILVIIMQTALIVALIIVLGQRRQAEQATRQREIEFRAIFENSRDAISVSSKGFLVMVNQAFLKMFGNESAAEMVGKPVGYNVVPEEKARIENYSRQRAFDNTIPIMYETRARTISGEEFDLEMHVSNYKLNDVNFNVAILRNVSERKRLEALTREAQVLQTELQKEKELLTLRERFISILSHEFRTPLAVMQTSLDLLTRYQDKLSEERRSEILQKIALQIKSLDTMIDNTLTLFRSQSDYIEFKPTQLNLEQLCRDVMEQIRLTDKLEHSFSFTSKLDDKKWMIDANLLKHILTNLLGNAVKYSPQRSPIDLELSQDEQHIIVSVHDEGIGIPQEDQMQLFEPFHRASNVGTQQGSGLGLSIVQQYVRLHGGTISVSSEVGKGSTFKLVLPKVLASESNLHPMNDK